MYRIDKRLYLNMISFYVDDVAQMVLINNFRIYVYQAFSIFVAESITYVIYRVKRPGRYWVICDLCFVWAIQVQTCVIKTYQCYSFCGPTAKLVRGLVEMAPQQNVRDALSQMKTAVRSGEIRKARVVGDSCSIPLTLSKLVRGLVEMAPQQNVRDALSQMKTAVRSGEIRKARVVGDSCSIPLTLSKQQVQLGSRIGGGQEGSVYLGCYQDEQVAVKQARIAATSDLERFREELAILSEIRHPNVVRVLGASAMPPHFFMVTPYYETMLDSVVYSKQWSADWCDILRIGTQLASALECVHAHGYVHRDVKPNNIMLDKDGNAVLIDFGLAADVKKVLTEFEMRQITNPSGGFHKQLMVSQRQLFVGGGD
eukprot:TRINITY_DN1719_c0_g1_i1.p2 TRINITY_DN1719_c0_g1~~TRINITY_DN1719_c0_g1_i1.p2  ORF type:complete len:370 (-),score=24.04 TRINITY_DN1719_c0_g1_i1:257-1366(-)